jgi:hypothetical protein
MKKIERLFFSGMVDYGGILPPEKKELKEVFKRYGKATKSKWGWILSRLMITTDLIDTATILSLHNQDIPKPIKLSLLVPGSGSFTDFRGLISSAERDLIKSHKESGGELKTDILEAAFPVEAIRSGNGALGKCFEFVFERMSVNKVLPEKAYFEVPGNDYDLNTLKQILKLIAKQNQLLEKKNPLYFSEFGFKITLKKEGQQNTPPLNYLSAAFLLCRELNVELKFQYSSSSAFTRLNNEGDILQYGFLNLFAAGVLSYSNDLTLEEVSRILLDDNPDNFMFSDRSFRYGDFLVPPGELKMLRNIAFPSFISSDLVSTLEEVVKAGRFLN